MKGSPAKPPRYPSARYNQQQPSAPPLSPPQSRGGEDDIPPMPPMPPMPTFPADLSGRTTDEPPSYMDDQMLLPPLAVPLGYGSGSSPPPYASAMPAMPVYRQQYQPMSPYRMSPPPLDANTQAPPAGGYFQYSANASTSPPQAFDMHRPRGSHRAYHQMYRQQSPQNQQQQPPSKCSSVWYFLKLLLFNAANGFLGIAGFAVVSTGLTLTLVTLPLCCFGIVLFRVLLRVVYVGCQIDAVLHNLIASSDEKIQFGAHHHYHHHPGHMSSLAERHSLLPTQIDWQLQPHHHQQDEDQLPQFEKTLAEVSPRAVLATIYFGSIKLLVGIFSLIAIGLVSFVIAFFVSSDDVHLMINGDGDAQEEDPFTVYMFAIGLAVFSIAMLFANARISQAITRFFCCEGGV